MPVGAVTLIPAELVSRCTAEEACAAGLDLDRVQDCVGRLGLVFGPVEAEAVRHHDEQPLLVEEEEFFAEEAGVGARLAVEGGDRAHVVAARDQGDADLEAGTVGRLDEAGELGLLLGGELGVEGKEDLLCEQVVAGGVAVGACCGADRCGGED